MQILTLPTGSIGTNTYFVYDEKDKTGFIVDPGGYSKVLANKIKELGIKLEYIILTHGHADHIMGIPDFKRDFPDVRIIANRNEKELLADSSFNMSDQFGMPTSIDADIFVDDNEEISAGGLKLNFFFTPGHSPGGMCVYIASENTLFSGDTLFQSSIGRTDFPGCSYEELIKSIQNKLWQLPDETNVFPGHMGPTTIGFEKENNPFV